jgi:hypothetical protein
VKPPRESCVRTYASPVTSLAAITACAVLAGLAVFQGALAAGQPLGRFAWGGQHRVLPARLRVGSVVSILVYGLIAAVVLHRAGLASTPLPDGFVTGATWTIAGYFLIGVGLNLASRNPAERAVMTPVALVLCALCLVVALG